MGNTYVKYKEMEANCMQERKNLRRTCFCWTDDMNIKVEGLISHETMVNGWGDKEKVLLFILWRRSWQLSNIVNKTRHSSKVVRLDHLVD